MTRAIDRAIVPTSSARASRSPARRVRCSHSSSWFRARASRDAAVASAAPVSTSLVCGGSSRMGSVHMQPGCRGGRRRRGEVTPAVNRRITRHGRRPSSVESNAGRDARHHVPDTGDCEPPGESLPPGVLCSGGSAPSSPAAVAIRRRPVSSIGYCWRIRPGHRIPRILLPGLIHLAQVHAIGLRREFANSIRCYSRP